MAIDFVPFELAKKLKEKEFDCSEPFAMYNELGVFHPLYTSCEEKLENCIFGNRCYYDYDDFDEYDCVCPTISQVLKWLREKKKIFVSVDISAVGWFYVISPIITKDGKEISREYEVDDKDFSDYNSAALAGIEYCLDNLI